MLKKLIDIIMNKNDNKNIYRINTDFLDDFIKINVLKNNKNISVVEYNNEIYDFFIESDIFEISKDKLYIKLNYENIYEIEQEYFDFFNLPKYFNGYIKIKNDANFLNKNGVKFEYEIFDDESKFIKYYPNIVQSYKNGSKQLLPKEQFELLCNIDNYNKGENNKIPSEQYKLLNSIKETSLKTSILLNETLSKKEEIEIIDNITIDFIKNEKGNFDLVPLIEGFTEEENRALQEEFKNKNYGKDFYTVNINGKEKKIIFNTILKKDVNNIKKNKAEVTLNELVEGDIGIDLVSENIEFNFGPRVKGLGFLPYRPSPPSNVSDVDWFNLEFPAIFHDEGSIKLKPKDLEYMEKKLDELKEDNEKIVLELLTEEGIKKINIDKENLNNEIKKLKRAIIDFTKISNKKKLQEVLNLMKNSDDEYIEYEGKYIKNEENIDIIEEYIQNKENVEKKEKNKKEVLLIKDNLEENEYKEEIELEKYIINFEKPTALKVDLYKHQIEGVSKLQYLYKKSKINGMLLCDDMGLGKTIQILTFLAWIKEKYELKTTLIILPTSLIENWIDEMKKFFIEETFSYEIMQGKETKEKISKYNNIDIVLTTYESLRINHITTGFIKWKVIICDEAQKIKNPKTLITTAIKSQNAEFKIACSATPIENTLEDLWCIADFVKPGLLGNLKDFRKEYILKRSSEEIDLKELNEQLNNILTNYYIRRTKDEVLKDNNFPKKIIKYQEVKISKKQNEILEEFYRQKDNGQSALPIIQGMLMNCSHPRLVYNEEELLQEDVNIFLEEAYKLKSIKSILDLVYLKKEKAIIFTKFRKMQEILSKTINYWFKFKPKIINGDYESSIRRNILKEFREKEGFNIIILSPEAAGVGLNIVEANHVIHYTRHWNPAKEEQATDRAYRIGQTKNVFVYYPVVSFSKEDIKETTFNNPNEWIDRHILEDVTNKSPEEKLNKIIIRKKRLLRDFFFSAIIDTTDTDQKEFLNDVKDSSYLTITSVDSIIEPLKFETLATILIEKEYNGKGYVTVKSGDAGIDGIVFSEKGNILIQATLIT